jgi:hypothetical protein
MQAVKAMELDKAASGSMSTNLAEKAQRKEEAGQGGALHARQQDWEMLCV